MGKCACGAELSHHNAKRCSRCSWIRKTGGRKRVDSAHVVERFCEKCGVRFEGHPYYHICEECEISEWRQNRSKIEVERHRRKKGGEPSGVRVVRGNSNKPKICVDCGKDITNGEDGIGRHFERWGNSRRCIPCGYKRRGLRVFSDSDVMVRVKCAHCGGEFGRPENRAKIKYCEECAPYMYYVSVLSARGKSNGKIARHRKRLPERGKYISGMHVSCVAQPQFIRMVNDVLAGKRVYVPMDNKVTVEDE